MNPVFIFSMTLNTKSCPNLALTNADYNWNTDAKNFAEGKISINQEKQSRQKKRKGKKRDWRQRVRLD